MTTANLIDLLKFVKTSNFYVDIEKLSQDDLEESLLLFDSIQLDSFFSDCYDRATSLRSRIKECTSNNKISSSIINGVGGVVTLCRAMVAAIKKKPHDMHQSHHFRDTLLLLHGLLVWIPSGGKSKKKTGNKLNSLHDLNNQICSLMYKCWDSLLDKQFSSKLMYHTLPIYLHTSLGAHGTLVRINELYRMRGVLASLSWELGTADVYIRGVTSLLEQCVVSPRFLLPNTTRNKGIHFLATVMTINEELMLSLHQTIKLSLGNFSKQQCRKFGELYYKAWTMSSEPMKQIFKEQLLNELIELAIYSSNGEYCKKMQSILQFFCDKKEDRRTADLLYHSLYCQHLSRSLYYDVPKILEHSITLWASVFPVSSSTTSVEEERNEVSKDVCRIMELTRCDYPTVRYQAVTHLCEVLHTSWNYLNTSWMRSADASITELSDVITNLLPSLVRDTSSSHMRYLVLCGVYHMSSDLHKYVVQFARNTSFLLSDPAAQVSVQYMRIVTKCLQDNPRLSISQLVSVSNLIASLASTVSDDVANERDEMIISLVRWHWFPRDDVRNQLARLDLTYPSLYHLYSQCLGPADAMPLVGPQFVLLCFLLLFYCEEQ